MILNSIVSDEGNMRNIVRNSAYSEIHIMLKTFSNIYIFEYLLFDYSRCSTSQLDGPYRFDVVIVIVAN